MEDEDASVATFDLPASQPTKGGRSQGFAGTQGKAGVVPRASYRVAHDEPLAQGRAVVRALRIHGENLVAHMGQQDLLAGNVAEQRISLAHRVERNAFGQVGQVIFGFVGTHLASLGRRGPDFAVQLRVRCRRSRNSRRRVASLRKAPRMTELVMAA